MKYVGSKRLIARQILGVIERLKIGEPSTFVDVFTGGGNLVQRVDKKKYNKIIGIDKDPYIISLLKRIRDNPQDPVFQKGLTYQEWKDVKDNPDRYPHYVIGYAGYMLTWGSVWFNTYMGYNKRKGRGKTRIEETYNSIQKESPKLQDIDFFAVDYKAVPDLVDTKDSIIYCDPPYKNTLKYKDDFDHDEFWETVREWVKAGAQVFVSEQVAPEDFIPVWNKSITRNITTQNKGGTKRLNESIFIHKSQLKRILKTKKLFYLAGRYGSKQEAKQYLPGLEDLAEKLLRKTKAIPVIPHKITYGFEERMPDWGGKDWLKRFCFPLLDKCNFLVYSNYDISPGVQGEVEYAREQGIPCLDIKTFSEVLNDG